MKRPTKAIIAAAGFGTRFLPQTKAMPKEMMPVIDKPIIQYVVEELVAAGIKDIIIVGSSNKRAIEDHFDLPNEDLLANLRAGGNKKKDILKQVEDIANMANFIYLRQKGLYGNATPVQCAAHLIGNEPFIYTFADDFFVAKPGRTKQLIETFTKHGGQVLACKKITFDDEYDRFGIVAGEKSDDVTVKVSKFIEKPGKANAPSDLASVNGYLLTPDVFEYIDRAAETHDGNSELMLQPIIQNMIDDGYGVFAREITNGKFYDTGDKLEYVKTVIDFGLSHPQLGGPLREYLMQILKK
ncbi:UTP--glucose-1-phosphate uridylyltransferase [Candidatus Saccharibacteria bacterium]|nr:UTP--glucose-1-phosphate uridylyltransferase [Candidatus Saccharibacteria bacterium]